MQYVRGTFAGRLRDQIHYAWRFTLEELARRVGITPQHLSRLLGARQEPGVEVAFNLAEELECSLHDLCTPDQ